jgi:hypothetical protein
VREQERARRRLYQLIAEADELSVAAGVTLTIEIHLWRPVPPPGEARKRKRNASNPR